MAQTLTYPPPFMGIRQDVPREQLPPEFVWKAENVMHYDGRIRKVPGYSQIGATLDSAVLRIVDVPLQNGNVSSVALTQGKAWEYSSGWVDRSGAAYSATTFWVTDMVSNQDILLATNGVDQVQKWTGPGNNFAAIGGSPPFTAAQGVADIQQHTVLWGTTESGTFQGARIRWSDAGLFETWTGGLSGTTTLAKPDFIVAVLPLTDDFWVIYRERSIWHMRYVGSPLVFFFEEKITGIGIVGVHAAETFGAVHFVVGSDDFYEYDGNRLQSVGERVRPEFYGVLDTSNQGRVTHLIDELSLSSYIFFPSVSSTSGIPDRAIIEDAEKVHGPDRAWWLRTDISPTGVGFWVEPSGTAWNALSGSWLAQTWRWQTAGLLADRPLTAWGDAAGKVYAFDPTLGDGDGNAIPCFFESGLIDVANEILGRSGETPPSGYRPSGKVQLQEISVEFETRGTQTFEVWIGTTDVLSAPIVWKKYTVSLSATSRQRFFPRTVARYFAYRMSCEGTGVAPTFGMITLDFEPDSDAR